MRDMAYEELLLRVVHLMYVTTSSVEWIPHFITLLEIGCRGLKNNLQALMAPERSLQSCVEIFLKASMAYSVTMAYTFEDIFGNAVPTLGFGELWWISLSSWSCG